MNERRFTFGHRLRLVCKICGAKLWTKCCYCLLSEVVYNVKIYMRPANYLTLSHKLDLDRNGALACITIRP
jgi:hypothetical protein